MLRALDLFCGAGGAAMGLHRAGFEVVGVDIAPQPHYPFEFVQADAMTYPLDGFDLIWASPPCQGYSIMRNLPWLRNREYPMLIEPVRARLANTQAAYVIENVPGAPLNRGSAVLCGLMFGLKVYRHRIFETRPGVLVPPHPKHPEIIGKGRKLNDRAIQSPGGIVSLVQKCRPDLAREAMGIPWMTRDELGQAIPPAYSEFLGRQVVNALEREKRLASRR